jgi:hypothetical protein
VVVDRDTNVLLRDEAAARCVPRYYSGSHAKRMMDTWTHCPGDYFLRSSFETFARLECFFRFSSLYDHDYSSPFMMMVVVHRCEC